MSTSQETKVITSVVIDNISERYSDVWGGFLQSGERAYDVDIDDGSLGTIMSRVIGPAYETAWRGFRQALDDGSIAAHGISEALSTCAANWRAAEQASIVEYR
ncbi:hypothetical protein [Nonomuraea sp. NPDC049695]|uniref:hypothetical protein n=1 Tax=Nonomuraea sp. NPDC049695 TaxID=3154734 RepID=UPI003438D0BB